MTALDDWAGKHAARCRKDGRPQSCPRADARAVHPLMEMPRFEGELTDDELAALAKFSIRKVGRRLGRVTAADVRKARLN
jgi:transcription initiation factor IIE alpha subunit